MNSKTRYKISILLLTWLLTAIGLLLFKYLTMYIYGKNILFDASSHIAWTSFGLYFIWYIFIENKKFLKIPYLFISAIILIVMAVQRMVVQEHNLIGVFLGLMVALTAIIIPRFNEIKK